MLINYVKKELITWTSGHGRKVVTLLWSLCGIALTIERVINKTSIKDKFRFMMVIVDNFEIIWFE